MRTLISRLALLSAVTLTPLLSTPASAQNEVATVPELSEAGLITGATVGFNGWGVEIFQLDRRGSFFQQGLDIGDVIVSINGVQLTQLNASLVYSQEVVRNQGQSVRLEVVDVRTGATNTLFAFLPFPVRAF